MGTIIIISMLALNFIIQNLCRQVIKSEQEKEFKDIEEFKFNDIGTSLDKRDIFVCDVKMGSD